MKKASGKTTSKTRQYRYRTVAPTSQVDETLFGNQKARPPDKSKKYQKGETIQIITRDQIRSIKIPRDPSDSINLPSAEFKRIISASQVTTKEETEALKEAYRRKKEAEFKAAEERKRQLYEIDLSRTENPALADLERDAQKWSEYLMKRVNAEMEQEEEIKNLNKLILNAQCQSIRDQQIQEKKKIQAKLSKEERRLDAMMEVDRLKALETEGQIEELQKKQRVKGMQQLHHQIQVRLEEKQLQDVTKELERQHMQETQEKMNLEDLEALEKRKLQQQRLHMEVMRINAENIQAKEQRREEERLADLRIMEYNQRKLEQEAEYEAEQKRVKREKESVISRLRTRQEKVKDYMAEQNERHARRIQEISDRQWRREQKELALKKAQEEAMLRAARMEQVHCKERFLSMEAGRERADFNRVLKVQEQALVRQKEMEEKQREKALRHADTIRQQIREHELSAIAKRREIFQQAHELTNEDHERLVRLNEVKETKLKKLRTMGLSEKCCKEVERKARDCTQKPQCEEQQNLPMMHKKSSEADLSTTFLPPISNPAKDTVRNLQYSDSNTCLPPIRNALPQRSRNQ
ncbi:cilia- and flagella-associated protein 45-like [Seriola aureovittata]|uniref:cilia- and flagella-associated protein 45-like n=1 Tax=Seriola aureovittata TaxID=2871759 RepID=UPI0024BDC3FD|nr:cilia- and flagella-associated protein 45-like [Seriola aureovittata]